MSNLTLGGVPLSGWTMYSLSIDEAVSQGLLGHGAQPGTDPPHPAALSLPTFYEGSFLIPDGIPDLPRDTYIKLPNWRKARDPHKIPIGLMFISVFTKTIKRVEKKNHLRKLIIRILVLIICF